MKRLFNDKVSPYLTLPNGMTVTLGGSTPILNEAILETPDIQELLKKKDIRVEEESGTANEA